VQALAPLLGPDETQVLYSIALHGRAELALAPDEYSGLMMVLLRMLAFRPQGAAVTAAAAPVSAPPAAAAPAPAAPVRPAVASRELLRPATASARLAVVPPAPVPAPAPIPAPKPAPLPVPVPAAAKPTTLAPWEEGPPADWDEIPLEGDPAPAPAPVVAAAAVVADALGTLDTLDDPLVTRWVALFTELTTRSNLTGLVRELAWQAQCLALDTQTTPRRIVLRVERESLRQQGHRDRLQAALGELLGDAVTLEVVAGAVTDSAARRDSARRVQAQNDAEATITNDPMVVDLLARYPAARIVPGSIRPVA
jgi:DNA polymerase-3 subunit gamma/tau